MERKKILMKEISRLCVGKLEDFECFGRKLFSICNCNHRTFNCNHMHIHLLILVSQVPIITSTIVYEIN